MIKSETEKLKTIPLHAQSLASSILVVGIVLFELSPFIINKKMN